MRIVSIEKKNQPKQIKCKCGATLEVEPSDICSSRIDRNELYLVFVCPNCNSKLCTGSLGWKL